ncbi:MAG: PilZ domain-containing protein [Candidatus Aminicenantes bacterium]|nr:PilZ domain-containing protein [Candidatus Aminicenantes bacterium]
MDNRKDKRFVERNTVFIKSTSEGHEPVYGNGINAHTYDISLSGARICTPQYFPVGSVVRIVIELERTHQSVKVDGEIKWTKKNEENDDLFNSGVEFLHSISQTLLSLIKHLYAEKNGGIPSAVSH